MESWLGHCQHQLCYKEGWESRCTFITLCWFCCTKNISSDIFACRGLLWKKTRKPAGVSPFALLPDWSHSGTCWQ